MAVAAPQQHTHVGGLLVRIAWRNLWRNARRTWLTVGGIAFATLLVAASMSLQAGSYASMIETATGFLSGHMQVSRATYVEDERFEDTIVGAEALLKVLRAQPGLAVAPRVIANVLTSVDERSFGGALFGVDFAAEQQVVNFFNNVPQGTLPTANDEVLIGRTMARNLGASVGDELMILGSAKFGGVAAMSLEIVGIFESGQVEIDRTLMFASLSAVQNSFALGDEVHLIVARSLNLEHESADLARIEAHLPPGLVVRGWRALLPDVVQGIEFDRISARIIYGALLVLVSFTVLNTFLMVSFERTREFGVLLALGMRPGLIVVQILCEALCYWVVGVTIGIAMAALLVGYYAHVGIPISGIEELANSLYVFDRIYPSLTLASLTTAPLVLLAGTQVAGLIATWRLRRLQPVVALRAE